MGERKLRHLIVAAAAVLLLYGCGSRSSIPKVSKEAVEAEAARQVAFGFETLVSETRRLQSVAFPIMSANTAYCADNAIPLYGLSVLTIDNLDEGLRAVASQRLGLDSRVSVVHAVKGSPARRAGLAPGDKIIGVDGKEIGDGIKGMERLARALGRAKSSSTLRVTIVRRERQLTLPMRPVPGCPTQVILSGIGDDEDLVESGAIVIHRGTLRMAGGDNELALVVGHELGHIIARHLKQKGRDAAGFRGGFPVSDRIPAETKDTAGDDGRGDFSEEQEAEADYLGLYFVARAAISTDNAQRLWRKIAQEDPRAMGFAEIHPTSPLRFLAMGKARDEIALKQKTKVPLNPNWPRQ